MVNERINYILDSPPTKYTQQAFMHASGIINHICVTQVSKFASR